MSKMRNILRVGNKNGLGAVLYIIFRNKFRVFFGGGREDSPTLSMVLLSFWDCGLSRSICRGDRTMERSQRASEASETFHQI